MVLVVSFLRLVRDDPVVGGVHRIEACKPVLLDPREVPLFQLKGDGEEGTLLGRHLFKLAGPLPYQGRMRAYSPPSPDQVRRRSRWDGGRSGVRVARLLHYHAVALMSNREVTGPASTVLIRVSNERIHTSQFDMFHRLADGGSMSNEKAGRLFAKRLRQRRKGKGWTQAELASKAGLTASAISQFETEEREPTFSSLVKLARALEVSPSFLSGLEEYDVDPSLRAFYREQQELSDADRDLLRSIASDLKRRGQESSD